MAMRARRNHPKELNHKTHRCKLVCFSLHDLVAKTSSKSHSALMRLLGSRFTGDHVAQQYVGPTYVASTRV